MVVAEVPLWVLHSNNASEAVATQSSAAAEPADEESKGIHRAKQSLALLQNTGKSRKCAIYSIDVHGNRFATAGGDGCVRLWSVSALFAPKQKGGKFSEEGAYVSTSSSSAGEDESEEDSSVANASTSNGNGAKEDAFEDQVEVHDLNSFVRRKKDGSHTPSPVKKPTGFTAPSPVLQSPGGSGSGGGFPVHAKDHQHQQHRLLCTLSAHTGSSVLAVRFSTSGNFLASAGDDSCVCIYAPQQNSSSQATGNLTEKAGPEHWARIKLCRGHGLDVVGLAWAPDDSHLVSCSLDSDTPIIVWKLTDLNNNNANAKSMICNPFRVLGKGIHTSTVKGVAFDPAGSYLASSGDDPAVCIWRAHDDWGLEKRVDASTGIFRQWNEDDGASLSGQSLFRRLSWSTDGAFVCSTNSVVKNKHVASTISREGWSVSNAQSAAAGAAHLVGHKQPVVVSRHASQLLDARKKEDRAYDDDDEEEEPEYATLLALGDKRGFVTVWSTRKARPLFKLQCSESHCTVTDLAWGTVSNGDLMLLVSLLDGQVVALRFGVPDELGGILSKKQQARVFQLRYGIDMDDIGGIGHGRLFVGGNSGPKLIENALQMSLEDRNEEEDDDEGDDNMDVDPFSQANDEPIQLAPRTIKEQQKVSSKQGKKRVRPVLMTVDASMDQRPKSTEPSATSGAKGPEQRKPTDPLQNAMDAAQKASTLAETAAPGKRDGLTREQSTGDRTLSDDGHVPPTPAKHSRVGHVPSAALPASAPISHSTDRIHTVELPPLESSLVGLICEKKSTPTAECTNALKIPPGSKGNSIPCIDLSISCDGRVSWKDQIPGTSCSAIAAARTVLAVGAADGSVQLFGSSPTLGWACGNAFRSHPPFVLGHAIVALQLHEKKNADETTNVMMLVVTADGSFGVYRILPELGLEYKGSLMPAMTHMSLASFVSGEHRFPKVSRVQVTESGRLLLLLSLMHPAARTNAVEHTPRGSARSTAPADGGVGGSLQAFVYDRPSELWMRISDSRFVLSDFYSSLPSARSKSKGVLSRMDDAVRLGALESSIKSSHRGRLSGSDRHADGIYNQAEEESGNYVATRSHCEDRMACALALGSASEFQYWLSLYARTLSVGGRGPLLRMLVDMLFGKKDSESTDSDSPGGASACCWWLSSAPQVLGLDRKTLVKSIVVPEMSKNRALQRITNEIALEVDS
jgi:protein HIRA/HIR1